VSLSGSWYEKTLPVVILLVLAGGALRIYRLGHQSLWTDEFATIRDSSLEISRPLREEPFEPSFFDRRIWRNPHGPLYYAFLHLWGQAAGADEFLLRLLSAVIGTATIPIVYLLARALVDSRSALIAGFLFAVSPFHIWFSQELRMYVLLMGASALFLVAAVRLADKASAKWASVYAAGGALSIFSFPSGAFTVGAVTLHVLLWWKSLRRLRRKWILATAVIAFFSLLFLFLTSDLIKALVAPKPLGVGRAETVGAPGVFERLGALGYTFFAFCAGFSLGPSVRELHMNTDPLAYPSDLPMVAAVCLVFGLAAIRGFWVLRRRKQVFSFLLLVTFLPIVVIFAVSLVKSAAFNVRYVSPSVIGFLLAVAAGVGTLSARDLRWTALGLVFGFSVISLGNHYWNDRYFKDDYRSAAQCVLKHEQQGDAVLAARSGGFRFYYRGRCPVRSPGSRSTVAGNLPGVLKWAGGFRRLWYVLKRPWEVDPKGLVKQALDKRFFLLQERAFPGVELYLYKVR